MLAVPGEITSALSAGTNRLLRQGATPLTSAADVLECFGLVLPERERPAVSPEAERLLERLGDGAAGADELARNLDLDAGVLAAVLAELEVAGLVSQEAGT